jgi:pyruvate kinase
VKISERKTRIVATLGPSSSSDDMIRRLVIAGVNVFRMNFSHGTHEIYKKNALSIRKIEQELKATVAIMMDLQGPKIRIGTFEDGQITLKVGAKFILDLEKDFGDSTRVTLPHPEIFSALRSETELLFDDGKIILKIRENRGDSIETEVVKGGVLSNKKGVNIPNVILPIAAITEKDKNDIAIIDDINADWVALSFVQTADDVSQARSLINRDVGILAKIEKPSAVQNIDSILNEADAIMVARGDLGIELPYETIPGLQRMLIKKARSHKKPVIVATQMLESMVSCYIPTRAEVSDVACAVAGGADAVMLSAETASGEYPKEAVETMARIVLRAEMDGTPSSSGDDDLRPMSSVSRAVSKFVDIDRVGPVVVFTESGKSVNDIANGRPNADIVAITPNMKISRRLCLTWGVTSIIADEIFSLSQMIQIAKNAVCQNYPITDGSKVVIIAGLPFRSSGPVNLIHICEIGEHDIAAAAAQVATP